MRVFTQLKKKNWANWYGMNWTIRYLKKSNRRFSCDTIQWIGSTMMKLNGKQMTTVEQHKLQTKTKPRIYRSVLFFFLGEKMKYGKSVLRILKKENNKMWKRTSTTYDNEINQKEIWERTQTHIHTHKAEQKKKWYGPNKRLSMKQNIWIWLVRFGSSQFCMPINANLFKIYMFFFSFFFFAVCRENQRLWDSLNFVFSDFVFKRCLNFAFGWNDEKRTSNVVRCKRKEGIIFYTFNYIN